MSLVLRQRCQPVLDQHSMGMFHVGVTTLTSYSGPNKSHLAIMTECGKEVCTLSGVTFARSVPSKEEVGIAVELLDAFIGTHTDKLKNYMSCFDTVASLPVLDKCPTNHVEIQHPDRFGNRMKIVITHDDYEIIGKFHEDDEEDIEWVQLKYHRTDAVDLDDLLKIPKFDRKIIKPALEWVKQHYTEVNARKALSEASAELSKCDI